MTHLRPMYHIYAVNLIHKRFYKLCTDTVHDNIFDNIFFVCEEHLNKCDVRLIKEKY